LRALECIEQHFLEFGALHAGSAPNVLPKLDQINLGKNLALRGAILEPLKRSAGALDRHSDPERTQHAHCVRLKRNSGAGGPPFRLALYELGAKSTLPQGDGGRQSRNPAARQRGYVRPLPSKAPFRLLKRNGFLIRWYQFRCRSTLADLDSAVLDCEEP
jgi:hypothetical protein